MKSDFGLSPRISRFLFGKRALRKQKRKKKKKLRVCSKDKDVFRENKSVALVEREQNNDNNEQERKLNCLRKKLVF